MVVNSTDAVVLCIQTISAIVSVTDICYCDKVIFCVTLFAFLVAPKHFVAAANIFVRDLLTKNEIYQYLCYL